jgi:TolB-like protein
MGLDEVGTARTLREHRKVTDALVAKHGGRLVKTTGDGVLLEFASVVDAVECAVAVQAVMAQRNEGIPQERRMLLRIGINLGDILIEGEDILGDGVNVAARLESIAEPGGISISSSAYDQVRDKVTVEFTDLGEQTLKNIARPIRAYAVSPNTKSNRAIPLPFSAPRLSLVVLPFANIGGDPEQDYFVDGVTESLTTDLSRISGSFVIAHNTALTFKGKPVDVKKLGHELNVRYILEGSVQRGGNRLRVNVQLIAAETGSHLWAERFDKPVADLFDMQDEIVSRLSNTLNAQLIAVEARRAERAPHPDATDLYFQGAAWANRGRNPEHMAQARGFFERALALEPENVEALLGTALVNFAIGINFLTDDRIEHLTAAEAAVTKALSLAPNHPIAHFVLGLVQTFTNRAAQGIAKYERALALIGIWPERTRTSGLRSSFSVAAGKPKPISSRRSASLPAIPTSIPGPFLSVSPNFGTAPKPKRLIGCAGALKPTEITLLRISIWRLSWRTSVSWMMHGLQRRRALRSIRVLASAAIVRTRQAAIPCILQAASASMRPCGWPGCRKGEA